MQFYTCNSTRALRNKADLEDISRFRSQLSRNVIGSIMLRCFLTMRPTIFLHVLTNSKREPQIHRFCTVDSVHKGTQLRRNILFSLESEFFLNCKLATASQFRRQLSCEKRLDWSCLEEVSSLDGLSCRTSQART
jgi:hypothetical protein